jgi:hypothetical protein
VRPMYLTGLPRTGTSALQSARHRPGSAPALTWEECFPIRSAVRSPRARGSRDSSATGLLRAATRQGPGLRQDPLRRRRHAGRVRALARSRVS